MQLGFRFGAHEDVAWFRARLTGHFGRPARFVMLAPVGQMVKSSISGRTLDDVSWCAYWRLVEAYPDWSRLAAAPARDAEAIIQDVTFAEAKAIHLRTALQRIAAECPDFDLSFLSEMTVESALAWLERLPGVARKVSASTLNFSTLGMPALVIDTHVLRILRRFGFVRSKATIPNAYDAMMPMLADWDAADLAELHMLAKRLGQTLCRPDHLDCHHCPIRARCRSAEGKCGSA